QEAATVLNRFLDPNDPAGHLTPDDCFVQKETLGCAGSEHMPLAQINPACLRREVGAGWLAVQSALTRVVRAQTGRQSARAPPSRWLNRGARKQSILEHSGRILDDLAELQNSESTVGGFIGAFSGFVGFLADSAVNPGAALRSAIDGGRNLLNLTDGIADQK